MIKTTEKIILSYDHYNREVAMDIVHFDSEKPGPHVFIQASVHGAELQGNVIIDQLIASLDEKNWSGKLSIVPFANPWATHAHHGGGTYGRFDAVTGYNWNRSYHCLIDDKKIEDFLTKHQVSSQTFKQDYKNLLNEILEDKVSESKEYGFRRGKRLTYELQKRSLQADIFLDLHTAPIAGLYLYAPEFLKNKAKDLSFPVNLIIPNEFDTAGDEAHFSPWTRLKEICDQKNIAFEIPIESYTIELGSEEFISQELGHAQMKHINQFLYRRGFLDKNPLPSDLPLGKFQTLDKFKTYYSDRACLCDYLATPGELVEAGQVIASLSNWNNETSSFEKRELKARANSIVVNHFSTSNLASGTEIYQLLENPLNY